ncbi:hypothetical protein CQZ93_08535 [Ochrobactrum vermis]|nr:hypothetical protein CQZ93_08535 [Ochrobactrum vermis]
MVEAFGAARLLWELSISSKAYAIDMSYQKWNYNSTIFCYECFILLNASRSACGDGIYAWRSAGMLQAEGKSVNANRRGVPDREE